MADANQNQHIDAALHYHESTKHSEESVCADPHVLDFDNQPLPFKIYDGVESVPLIRDPDVLDRATPPALDAISVPVSPVAEDPAARIPDLAALSQVLFLAAGINKRKHYSGGEVYFRAYSNTGALPARSWWRRRANTPVSHGRVPVSIVTAFHIDYPTIDAVHPMLRKFSQDHFSDKALIRALAGIS